MTKPATTKPDSSRSGAVLLIDDDPDCHRLFRDALAVSKFGCALYGVHSGPEALEFLYRRGGRADAPRPDLIYLDIEMPGLSGHDVLKMLKADPDLCDIPVVVITGSNDAMHESKAVRNGAAGFLVKPIDPAALTRSAAAAMPRGLGQCV